MKLTTALAALLLVAIVCQVTHVSAQKHRKRGGNDGKPLYMFGWTPVQFDPNPVQEIEPIQRRPKTLNFRCKQACARLQLQAVLTPKLTPDDIQKPLCYFNATRALGATYQIYGTWYEGEAAEGYESTCRGRDENGKEYKEWANKWNATLKTYVPGYMCGCCGCVYNCGWKPNNTRSGGDTCGNSYYMLNSATGCAKYSNGSRTTYPVCYGKTASFGYEWGTWLSDDTCTTYRSLVAEDPSYMCVPQAGPPAKTAPPPNKPAPKRRREVMVRLDEIMGLSVPVITEEVIREVVEARKNRPAQEP